MVDLEFRVYHAATDMIYSAGQKLAFVPPAAVGTFTEPFLLDIGAQPDEDIDLIPLAEQVSLETFSFDDVDLDTLLITSDNDPVVWSIEVLDEGVAFTLDGALLSARGADGFTGTARVRITATEQDPGMHTTSQIVTYRVVPLRGAPRWTGIGPQRADQGETFSSIDLTDFVQPDPTTDCYSIDYLPILNRLERDTFVTWTMPDGGSFLSTMTITGTTRYTPNFTFSHPLDRIAAFIDGELRGVGEPVTIDGQRLFFITIGNNSGNLDPIRLVFYSGRFREVYEYPLNLLFRSQAQLGSPRMPEMLDFSPFMVEISADTILTTTVRNPDWSGLEAYSFFARDCEFPEEIKSIKQIPFCYALADPTASRPVTLVEGPVPACQLRALDLSLLVEAIDETPGMLYAWFSSGDGDFLDADGGITNDYRNAVGYLPGILDTEKRSVDITLSLTSGYEMSCDRLGDTAPLEILIVDAGAFFWGGQ